MSDASAETVAGKVGQVVVEIPGGGRPGEVLVQVRGGTETFIAYAEQVVERGRDVLIICERGGRAVEVIST